MPVNCNKCNILSNPLNLVCTGEKTHNHNGLLKIFTVAAEIKQQFFNYFSKR